MSLPPLDITPTDALVRVEREILCAEEAICQKIVFLCHLRAKRNLLLPVSRLPPEILASIFKRGARNYYKSCKGGNFTRHIPTWVNVSYVCSHWRNIALSCPNLWTYHFNLSLRWTEELLLRSKDASLKISCIFPFSKDDEEVSWFQSLLDNLQKHSERIQELRLHIPPFFRPSKLSLYVPRIKTLDIAGFPDQCIAINDACMHSLRTLKLKKCSLPWHLFNLTGLTTLSLCCVHPPSPPNTVEFLTILNSIQNLILLDLDSVLPSARKFLSSGGPDAVQKINLPRLAVLRVIAPLSTVVALISCVNIPPRTQFCLRPLFERGSCADDYSPLLSFLAQRFSVSEESSGPVLRSLSLDAMNEFTLTLNIGCEALSPLRFKFPLEITLGDETLDDEITFVDSDAYPILIHICRSLPLTNIQRLHVIEPDELPSDFWREILGPLDGLRYMKLSHGSMPDLSLLSLPAHESNENQGGQSIPDQHPARHMFVPALEELEFHRLFSVDNSPPDTFSTRKGLQCHFT